MNPYNPGVAGVPTIERVRGLVSPANQEARDKARIPHTMDNLACGLDSQLSLLDELHAKLRPVLGPPTLTSDSGTPTEPGPKEKEILVTLSDNLNQLGGRVASHNHFIRAIIDLLEL